LTILLVRHGETPLNAARVVQPADTPLSERGLRQAALLATRLADKAHRPVAIISSDLPRALMTAEAIGRATGLVVRQMTDLQERNFGLVRGTPYAQLREDIFHPSYQPPEGETQQAFDERVDLAWEAVVQARAALDGPLAVVTHGLFCRSVLSRRTELGELAVPARWFNTSLTVIGDTPPHRVSLLNDVAHLGELEQPGGAAV